MWYQCLSVSFYLKFLLKNGHYSKIIAFRVMPLVLQLHLVMMSRYSKFGVDTFSTFRVMGYIKFLHNDDNDDDDLVITLAKPLLLNRQVKNY